MGERRRSVSAHLTLSVSTPTEVVAQVAVAELTPGSVEQLVCSLDGIPVEPVEVPMPGEGRVHHMSVGPGLLDIRYDATVVGDAAVPIVTTADEIVYLRPSRYVESDHLSAVAAAEFAGIDDKRELLAAVSSWVGSHLMYVAGSSRPTDGAIETMLQRQGVCRDFAHLVAALLRGLDVPARIAAVYAPGLSPMDFHAVAEAAIDGRWYAVDATLLAPRSSLVRIGSGRDAADTAFLSTYSGHAELMNIEVLAVVDGDLPRDDVHELVQLR